ncbi:peptide chain release factor 2 [Simkania negevensis]|uniref:Peptide chain release factor 2 n=1 Tax=Simkania negevensis TaxID=83561 RepID=A0ABS3APV8_9BACT|nr:peptide chain release factor 2 [Simkania negevensis]
MNEEVQALLNDLKDRLLKMRRYLDVDAKKKRVDEIKFLMEEHGFWNDNNSANELIQENKKLVAWTAPFFDLSGRLADVVDLLPEAYDTGEDRLVEELVDELYAVDKELGELELQKMLSGELDDKNCFVSINAGAGGTEACDWVQMLVRMYRKWATTRGWKVETVDLVEGDVVGIKNVTMKIVGNFSFGYAKAEKGIHRLVRISPFDSGARRHTSFASVDVTPEITDDIDVDIKPEELRIDTFRASGAGGQHINVTDSAVRITHTPTGIIVSCQNQRSQHQNKDTCMKLLRSKLYEMQVSQREEKLKALTGEKKEIAWGNQIRNYVFQPYTLVKDTRTGHEIGNIQAMMDGEELDGFITEYLKKFG